MNNKFAFVGSTKGRWTVDLITPVTGKSLETVPFVDVIPGYPNSETKSAAAWIISAATSHLRYTSKEEKMKLTDNSLRLGARNFDVAMMIPIKKSMEWWNMAQDERRRIFEEHSHHIQNGLAYSNIIARQLYHCTGSSEEFDFVTWFEFNSSNKDQFSRLCELLRKSEEWKYVIREVDIHLTKG